MFKNIFTILSKRIEPSFSDKDLGRWPTLGIGSSKLDADVTIGTFGQLALALNWTELIIFHIYLFQRYILLIGPQNMPILSRSYLPKRLATKTHMVKGH